MTHLAPTWKPKIFHKGDPNPKKSMLEDKQFPASIFKGFGRRFGKVFGWFFGPKMHAKSEWKKRSQQAKNMGKTNTKSMLALLQQWLSRIKMAEKSHVCWHIDFGGVLEGFWHGFGKPKSSIFVFFSMFFRNHF